MKITIKQNDKAKEEFDSSESSKEIENFLEVRRTLITRHFCLNYLQAINFGCERSTSTQFIMC